MGLSSVELWQRIAASQLASPLLCRTWAADAAAALSASEAIDGWRVGEQLVSQGKLTRFQIDTLLGDNQLPLIRNGYRLLEPVDYAPCAAPDVRSVWHNWWAVAKTPTSPTLWMRWIQADELKQPTLAQSNPALPRALQQSQLRHAGLQVVLPPEMAKGTLQVCVEPVQGRLLSGQCDGRTKPIELVGKVLTDMAAALMPLHTVGVAHGRVTPDRICVNDAGQHVLLRDPLCAATMHMSTKAATVSGLLAPQLPSKLDAVHFMAPEFLLPAQVATAQSDLYSLGCVAWMLLTGQAPYNAKQPELVLAAQAEQPLDMSQLPRDLPEPFTRCLLHCLAKNPGARFSHAAQLLNAWQEAQRVVARGPSAQAKPPVKLAPVKPTPPVKPAPSVKASPPVKPAPPLEAEVIAAETVVEDTPVVAKPLVTKPVESKPVESKPVESKPVESKPVESKPVESKPVESKPVESKPVESKPAAAPAEPIVPAVSKATASPVPTVLVVASQPKVAPASPAVPAPNVASSSKQTSVSQPTATKPVTVEPTSPPTATPPGQEQPNTEQPNTEQLANDQTTSHPPTTGQSLPAQPAASPLPSKRLAQPGKPPGRRSPVRKSKKSQRVNWLTPVIGGGALLALVLIVMVMNGGGSSSNGSANNNGAGKNSNAAQNTAQGTSPAATEPVAVDPMAEKYELVSDSPSALWAPPRVAEPIQMDLLPPGGQFFACLRPTRLMAQADVKQLLSLLDTDLSPLWKSITETSGVPLEQIDHVILAAFPTESGAPHTALRVKLIEGQPLSQLKAKWQSPTDTKVTEHSLLVSGSRAFYVAQQPLLDSQSVTEFSVGPVDIMREAAELKGTAPAMSGQMEQLRQTTDQAADINLLVNPVFFYTEGRFWLDHSPPRFRSELEQWATRDQRAMMLSTSFSDPWYYELRMMGATDRDSVALMQKLKNVKQQLPQAIESWLVSELPHPHWRAMANRFPNMLRALDAQTRAGTENGQAVVNGYLPLAAAPNLIYASWMAVQPGSTVSTGNIATNSNGSTAATPLTPEQILDRKITLTIDQTGIENVLQAIGEQANDKLPAGTKPLRFELDGAGFQRSGITRNQQIKDYQVKDQTVREALIVLSKKGNPVQPLNDLKSDDQKLIWVLIDGANPEKALLSLTSREAAVSAGHKLPAEFVK